MLRNLVTLSLVALLSGCATEKNDRSLLDTTLESYANIIRWGNFEDAVAFVDPETIKTHPVTRIDLDRYTQVHVSGYSEQPPRPAGEHEMRQTVEISLVNNNTQTMRTIVDHQVWRYDAKGKHWWLVSGLPDITQH